MKVGKKREAEQREMCRTQGEVKHWIRAEEARGLWRQSVLYTFNFLTRAPASPSPSAPPGADVTIDAQKVTQSVFAERRHNGVCSTKPRTTCTNAAALLALQRWKAARRLQFLPSC